MKEEIVSHYFYFSMKPDSWLILEVLTKWDNTQYHAIEFSTKD